MIEINNNFVIHKNALVKVSTRLIKNDDLRLVLEIENEMPFVFPKSAYENSFIQKMDSSSLSEKFNGGTYVFLNGELISYKDSSYNGFVRSSDQMKELSDVIGCSVSTNSNKSAVNGLFNSFRQNTLSKGLFLGGKGQEFDLEIGELGEGGKFHNNLVHRWNPFSQNVIVSLETERLICTNGMVGMSSFVTNEVPVVNRIAEHIELISVQLAPQLNNILKHRFSDMSKNNISLSQLVRTNDLLSDRLNAMDKNNKTPENEKSRFELSELIKMTDAKRTMSNIYDPSVFKSKEKSYGLCGDLSQFDVFNILTEASTHTKSTQENNNLLQKQANSLVFDELESKKNIQSDLPFCSDSDHARAFFGRK